MVFFIARINNTSKSKLHVKTLLVYSLETRIQDFELRNINFSVEDNYCHVSFFFCAWLILGITERLRVE